MKHFTHDPEIPWECKCTKPDYVWEEMVEDKILIDVVEEHMGPYSPITLTKTKYAVQLNYLQSRPDLSLRCSVCGLYKHRIVPNPFRKK